MALVQIDKHAAESAHTRSGFAVHIAINSPPPFPRSLTPTSCKLVPRGLALESAWRLCRERCGSPTLDSQSGRREESSRKKNACLVGTSWPRTTVEEWAARGGSVVTVVYEVPPFGLVAMRFCGRTGASGNLTAQTHIPLYTK